MRASLQSPGSTPPVSPFHRSPKVIALPDKYDGNPETCKGFLMQCSMYLTRHQDKFPADIDRIHFVLSLLTGRVLEWATALWHQNNDVLKNEAQFHALFKEVFDHPAAGRDVGNRLCEIEQGKRSAADYALEFRTLAAGSGWNDAALLTN